MSRTFFASGPITRNCTGKPTGGPKLNRSTRTRASDIAPSATAFSIRSLIRSRASTSFETITISAKDSKSEPEPRRPLADVGGICRDILVAFEQPFGPLYRLERRADRRSRRKPQLEEQLGPFGQRKELLLDMAEANDRQHKDADRCEHHSHASLDAPLDDPA